MMSAIKPLTHHPQQSYTDTLSRKYSLAFPHSSENRDVQCSATFTDDEMCHLVNCE